MPKPSASASNPSKPNLQLVLEETISLTVPDGTPTTGLDADVRGPYLNYSGFPTLPTAMYTGSGFNGTGSGGHRISVDSEGLFLASTPQERLELLGGLPTYVQPRRSHQPPDVITISLTVSSDGKRPHTLLQSALAQEGGTGNPERKQSRLLEYDNSGTTPIYKNEWVVTLPLYKDDKKVATQSEIHYISDTQFLILARDYDAGRGQGNDTKSLYRHVDLYDISNVTSIESSKNDAATWSIATSKGKLDSGIIAAKYCPFLDFRVNSQLARFGLHNGGDQNASLLNEKWESLAREPVYPDQKPNKRIEYYLCSLSDNDSITQEGHMNFGKFDYKDASGCTLDNQALVFHITISP